MIEETYVLSVSMAAVGQLLTHATQPVHVSCVSTHSEQSCLALIPKQASGFTALAFPSRSSKTNAGQTETHIPQPSQVSRSILTLGISILPRCTVGEHISPQKGLLVPSTRLPQSPNKSYGAFAKFRQSEMDSCAPDFIHFAASRKIGLGETSITGMSNVPTLIENSYSGIRANTTSVQ